MSQAPTQTSAASTLRGVKVSRFGVLVLPQTRQRQGAKNGLFCLPSNSRQAQLLGGVSAVGKSKVGKRAAKHRFGLHRFGQGTLLGVYRWLVLSLIAYILAHWAYLSTSTTDLPD